MSGTMHSTSPILRSVSQSSSLDMIHALVGRSG
jgi:hypothetical protein